MGGGAITRAGRWGGPCRVRRQRLVLQACPALRGPPLPTHRPPPAPSPPPPKKTVFTSSVGNEAVVGVIALSILPSLIESKNRLQGTDDEVSAAPTHPPTHPPT